MAKLPDLFINAVTTFDGKALAKGEKAVASFAKNAAKSLGLAFSATAVVAFGKASVKAFAEDEAAAARLSTAVKNLGLQFEDTRITRFIADLENTAAVADDQLRPAFQALLSTTGSVTRSQEMLSLALDISAGSGVGLEEVSKDLSLAYLGQTKGIAKYNTGLTKAELSTAGFVKVQKALNDQYSGQNAARLDTYAGRAAALGVAFGNLQETVGQALIDAFMKLSGDTSVEEMTQSIDDLADSLAGLVEVAGTVASPFVGLAKLLNLASDNYVKFLYKVTGAAYMGKVSERQYGGIYAEQYKKTEETANAKARAKAEADAAKRAKEILALTRKQQIAEKNKLALTKAAAVFDTQRISLAAALKATYDKETRLRLEALIAIEEDNGDLALRKIGELAALQKNSDLAKLAGIKEISDATLLAINTQLLTELTAINKSKMAEGDKELAREEAFKKYNAAIVAAGQLAAKESYSERVQIQLTEIARLASLSKTTSAATTATLLRESAELSMIDRVAKAQKAADDARLKALQEYMDLLGKVGTKQMPANPYDGTWQNKGGGSSSGGGLAGGGSSYAAVATKEAADAVKYFAENVTDTFQTIEDSGAFNALVKSYMGGAIGSFNAGDFRATEGGSLFNSGAVGSRDRDVNITINAGFGTDPEALTRAVEDAFNQSGYRGTSTNRSTGLYIE
jgi:hypothetical protein